MESAQAKVLTSDSDRFPYRSHRSAIVAKPTVKTMNKPTNFTLKIHDMQILDRIQ